MNGFRLSVGAIALAVALVALAFVIVNDLRMCRRLFCTEQVVRWADGVNLVQNPSFEGGDLQPGPQGFMSLPPVALDSPIGRLLGGQGRTWPGFRTGTPLASKLAITMPESVFWISRAAWTKPTPRDLSQGCGKLSRPPAGNPTNCRF
jgi:hypothetical protein